MHKKLLFTLQQNKFFIVTGSISIFCIYRFNYNFNAYEKAIKKEKVFDVRKANEQLRIYKELYNPKSDVEVNNRLLNAASKEDKALIKEIFSKYESLDKEGLEKEIKKIKDEVEFLEDRKQTHQGIKLAKVYYGYEPSEDALKKIRSNYNEHRKKIEVGEKEAGSQSIVNKVLGSVSK